MPRSRCREMHVRNLGYGALGSGCKELPALDLTSQAMSVCLRSKVASCICHTNSFFFVLVRTRVPCCMAKFRSRALAFSLLLGVYSSVTGDSWLLERMWWHMWWHRVLAPLRGHDLLGFFHQAIHFSYVLGASHPEQSHPEL